MWGVGLCPLPLLPRGLLPVDVTDAPKLSVEGPQSVPSGLVTAGWRDEAGWCVCRLRRCWIAARGGGGTLPSLDVAGSLLPVVPAGGSPKGVLRTLLAQLARIGNR